MFLLACRSMVLLLVARAGAAAGVSAIPTRAGSTSLSAALSLAAVLAVIYGLKRHRRRTAPAGRRRWRSSAGLALGAVFVRRQRRLADPLIDLWLFRAPAFSAALAVNTLGFFIAFGTFLFIAQYLQLVLGLSPLAAGLWTVPRRVGFVAGSMLTPRSSSAAGVRSCIMRAACCWPRSASRSSTQPRRRAARCS